MARCLALLGMVATHVLDERRADGSLTAAQWLAGGRASALFAVLAGVSMALVTGRRHPLAGAARGRASAGLVVRAVLVGALGLLLGTLGTGIAVILTYYAILFVLALPFLGLRAPTLAALAVGWMVAAPVLSHVVRPELPERDFASPTLQQLLDDPSGLLAELTFTGYYPAVPWLAYVLTGLAVGRLDLSSRRTASLLALGGGLLAVGATVVSRMLTARPEVQRALLDDPPATDADAVALLERIAEGLPGSTPTGGAGEWLLVVAPHTATPFDLAQTIGSALLVVGAALLLVGAARPVPRHAVAVFFGAGTMTLSLYSLHVVARTPGLLPDALRDSYLFHVLLLLGTGLMLTAAGLRGPLEATVGGVARTVAGRPQTRPRLDP